MAERWAKLSRKSPLRRFLSGLRGTRTPIPHRHRKAAPKLSEQYFHLTHPGMRRPTNQDQTITTSLPDGRLLLLVADGVGGAGGGEVASATTRESMVARLTEIDIDDPATALREAVREANMRVRMLATTDKRLSSMATTLVAAIVEGSTAWIINVGDSRAYLCANGAAEALTLDDSWVAEQVRAGALTPEEAAESPYQNVITRGVGVEDGINVEVVLKRTLAPGEVILLCSDGLYRHVSPEEIAAVVAEQPLSVAGKALIEMANDAGGLDNISVAIYRHSA